MLRRAVLLLLCLGPGVLWAQDLDNFQIHGFATQGFLYSSHNNYLSMKSNSGSLQWTEGAVSLSNALTDKLRVGIQFHMYQMGTIGGPNVMIDWASGDYKVNDHLGFRVGKIKSPLGLFNDSQDIDSLFLWVLLPQSMYPIDNRGYYLSELGGEVYGSFSLGERLGTMHYDGHTGASYLDPNGGYSQLLEEMGMTFPQPPGGVSTGGNLRWATPLKGLSVKVGASNDSLDATGPQGTFRMPSSLTLAYSAQFDRGRLHLAAEYWRTPLHLTFNTLTGSFIQPMDQRSWYPMVRYELTKKLQVGTYYSHFSDTAGDASLASNYSKDWAVSGRYDFNSYFYAKVEGHFLHGTGLGYYASTNPNGLSPNSNMLAARIGFNF